MVRKYGVKGERIFYASINKGVKHSEEWHVKENKPTGTNQFTAGLAAAL